MFINLSFYRVEFWLYGFSFLKASTILTKKYFYIKCPDNAYLCQKKHIINSTSSLRKEIPEVIISHFFLGQAIPKWTQKDRYITGEWQVTGYYRYLENQVLLWVTPTSAKLATCWQMAVLREFLACQRGLHHPCLDHLSGILYCKVHFIPVFEWMVKSVWSVEFKLWAFYYP